MAFAEAMNRVMLLPSEQTLAEAANAVRWLACPPRDTQFRAIDGQSRHSAREYMDSAHPPIALIVGSKTDEAHWRPWLVGLSCPASPTMPVPAEGTGHAGYTLRLDTQHHANDLGIPRPDNLEHDQVVSELAGLQWKGQRLGTRILSAMHDDNYRVQIREMPSKYGFSDRLMLLLTPDRHDFASPACDRGLCELGLSIVADRLSEVLDIPFFDSQSLVTHQESVVASLLARGMSVNQAASVLKRSPFSVHDHIKSLHKKLDVQSRSQLIARLVGLEPVALDLAGPSGPVQAPASV